MVLHGIQQHQKPWLTIHAASLGQGATSCGTLCKLNCLAVVSFVWLAYNTPLPIAPNLATNWTEVCGRCSC